MPSISTLPKDEIGREIALLLLEHPEIATRVGDVDLKSLSEEAQWTVLESIRDMLGIKPFRSRSLGYVGS